MILELLSKNNYYIKIKHDKMNILFKYSSSCKLTDLFI